MRCRIHNYDFVIDARVTSCILISLVLVMSYCHILDGISTNKININIRQTLSKLRPKITDLTPGQRYACLSRGGRLGNHMFQYASIFGITRVFNITILVQDDHDIVQFFSLSSAKVLKSTAICKTFKKLKEEKCCTYDSSLTSLPGNGSYVIGDYLQSWRYFKDNYPQVRRELTFKAEIHASAKFIVENFRQSLSERSSCRHHGNVTMVGVHVRMGDMIEYSRGGSGFDVAPEGYIQRAVDYFLERHDCVLFLVCSDGMDYARRIFRYRNVSAEFVELPAIQDMAVLAACDHVIMTVGTFGWWAGFLSGGVVVYYKYPLREGSPGRNNYNYTDFFLPNWVGLP